MKTSHPVIIVLNDASMPIAQTVAGAIDGVEIHGLEKRVGSAPFFFTETITHLQKLFTEGRSIIGVCASGILIRAIGPLLANKGNEPAVIAVAQDGKTVVPLLGGHHGGNKLAGDIAHCLDATLALTTASETVFEIALDDPPTAYHLANPEHLKPFASALLAGEQVNLKGDAAWLSTSALPIDTQGNLTLTVSEFQETGSPDHLIYNPERLAVGVGCERGCTSEELEALVRTTLSEANLAQASIALMGSVDLKCDEPAITAVATALGCPTRYFSAERLEEETPRLANPSEVVFNAVGCHGVAEAAALSAVGSDGNLIVEKRKSLRATCAIAKSKQIIHPNTVGRAKGSLAVVGLGPGKLDWRTSEASAHIANATDLVGYQGYLDLIGNIPATKTQHAYGLGEETTRVDAALDIAATGKNVALICSGDPGIYAMASLVFERLDHIRKSDWKWVDITVSPGISALQAAAARIGAPLGHDFCAISLSDLLTPWPVIERRLEAAATGDFVVALYNPASQKRRNQLVRALEIMTPRRNPDTPVIAARHLGRPEEAISVHPIADFDPEIVDMSTLVLIGSTETRQMEGAQNWVYTPRGYGDKSPAKEKATS
jgi:cobalt-precorrin 5A hydrolase / precorrin-3B C17-methyltransferase